MSKTKPARAQKKIKHPFLQGLPAKYLDTFVSHAKEITLMPGEYVFKNGQRAEKFFLLLEGEVEITTGAQDIRLDSEPHTLVLQVLGPGEIIGWSWIIPPYTWRFDVRVRDDAKLLCVDGAYIRKLCEKDHDLAYEIYKRLVPIMNQRMIAARQQFILFGSQAHSDAEGA